MTGGPTWIATQARLDWGLGSKSAVAVRVAPPPMRTSLRPPTLDHHTWEPKVGGPVGKIGVPPTSARGTAGEVLTAPPGPTHDQHEAPLQGGDN